MTRYPSSSLGMRQTKILLLATIVLLAVFLSGCPFGAAQVTGGWSGTAFRDGTIYAGTLQGAVVAINATTRSPQWPDPHRVTIPAEGLQCGPAAVAAPLYATPTVVGDVVYIGTYAGEVLALNTVARSQGLPFPQRGAGEWVEFLDGQAGNNAVVADLAVRDDLLYVSASDGRVYCLSRAFGDFVARSEVLDQRHRKLWTSPVIHNEAVYVSTFEGHIRALSADTLELLDWSFEADAGFASSPVIHDDILYVGSFDNRLYAVRIGDSDPLWTFRGGQWFWASPVVYEGVVYAACLDGRVYAIGAETGVELGRFNSGSPIVSSPVLMDDLLIVANEQGVVDVFDLSGGPESLEVPFRSITIGDKVRSSFSAHDGFVYIRGEDNHLYVVDIDEGRVVWDVPLDIEE